jgi:hypothetical protein
MGSTEKLNPHLYFTQCIYIEFLPGLFELPLRIPLEIVEHVDGFVGAELLEDYGEGDVVGVARRQGQVCEDALVVQDVGHARQELTASGHRKFHELH